MAIRVFATYEFVDKEGNAAGMVRLPVVGYAPPDENGRQRPRVLLLSDDDPCLVDFHPASTIETRFGTFEALFVDAVDDPIPAQPGWTAEIWISPPDQDPKLLGAYDVLAWEPEPQTSIDDYPAGHAVLLIPERDDNIGSHSGPVSTRDLAGEVRYRRE